MMLKKHNGYVGTARLNICVRLFRRFVSVWRGHNIGQVDLTTHSALRARAWIFQAALSIIQLGQIITESGSFFGEPSICDDTAEAKTDCINDYNKELLDRLRPVTGLLLRVIFAVSAIGCIACCKWR